MEQFFEVIARFKLCLGAETIAELSDGLDLPLEDVKSAVEERAVPAAWYVAAFIKQGVNPDWLQKGEGAMLAPPPDGLSRGLREKLARLAELLRRLPAPLQDCVLSIAGDMARTHALTRGGECGYAAVASANISIISPDVSRIKNQDAKIKQSEALALPQKAR